MEWRIFCAVVGLLGGFGSLAALAYAFTPAFRLEPRPGFEASVAVIVLLISARLLWWAFGPLPKSDD
ncbi:MAG TPA: hypothetical protein VFH92_01335 [Phenylobacterium sp.]|nr:hypothetical protein [Phenylobacterium sp.]